MESSVSLSLVAPLGMVVFLRIACCSNAEALQRLMDKVDKGVELLQNLSAKVQNSVLMLQRWAASWRWNCIFEWHILNIMHRVLFWLTRQGSSQGRNPSKRPIAEADANLLITNCLASFESWDSVPHSKSEKIFSKGKPEEANNVSLPWGCISLLHTGNAGSMYETSKVAGSRAYRGLWENV